MYPSPVRHLSEPARADVSEALNAVLSDGLDLHGQIKVAHWNIKGPHFATLHPLFETFAVALAAHTDAIAERAVTLGAVAVGGAKDVAKNSRLPAFPEGKVRDLELAAILADRFDAFLDGARAARAVADGQKDIDSSDLLTGVVADFEKHAWFLRATIG